MYIHMYTYIHLYKYICIYTYSSTYIYKYIGIYMNTIIIYTCIFLYDTHTLTLPNTQTHTHTPTPHIHAHAGGMTVRLLALCMQPIWVGSCRRPNSRYGTAHLTSKINVYAYIHIYIYIYTYTYIYTGSLESARKSEVLCVWQQCWWGTFNTWSIEHFDPEILILSFLAVQQKFAWYETDISRFCIIKDEGFKPWKGT